MNRKLFPILFFIFIAITCNAQIADSVKTASEPIIVDTIGIVISENTIKNPKAIASFFLKLDSLQKEKKGKINIVHIGDSHLQADFMSGKTRKKLQSIFGNAGRGFVFPHNLAKTNGAWDVKFSSNASWLAYRIVMPVTENNMGLSGIALTTKESDFYMEISQKEAEYKFNQIKIITPKNEEFFQVALDKVIDKVPVEITKSVFHKVKKRETILTIANLYGVSIAEIKRANSLKKNRIVKGKKLRIPKDIVITNYIEKVKYIKLPTKKNDLFYSFKTDSLVSKICLVPNNLETEYALNGIVLENDNPGILYHNIGINGAKLSDYNKYSIFFEQLKVLQPDLIIVSLGTNESFDKLKTDKFITTLDLFLQNIKTHNKNTNFLISTPPPSLFERRLPNNFIADYSEKLKNIAPENSYAVWDLYNQMNGFYGISKIIKQKFMAPDRVHYTKTGYEKQGVLLAEALLKSFEEYKNQKNK